MTPLSQGERALWFLHHLAPVGGAYNIAAAARVRTPLDASALERAFQALVDRHTALRTTFPAVSGEPRRQVAGEQGFALSTEDATGWGEERLWTRLAEEAWRPFDLERGPLLRVTLFTGDSGGPLLLLVIHHIVADFWSLAILMRELPALYRGAALSPPGRGYEEHVRLEREVLEGERGAELLAWWRERLTGLPTLELAIDRPRPAVQTYRGDTARLRLPGELSAALRARSRAQRGTLFMTLVAAFEALLGRYTGQEDLAVGSPRAGRGAAQFAGTVGYFVNPVVLRGDLSGDPTFAELLERTRAVVLAAFEHGECPLPLLAEHLQPERDASRTPLFQVSFVLQKETRGAEGLTAFALGEEGVEVGPEDFRLESLSVPQPPSAFDLALHAVERQGGSSFALQYNADLFDPATAERLLEHFARLLAGVAAEPQQRLSELPMLSAAERAQLLAEWNDTAVAPASVAPDLPTGTAPLVHELVFAQARRQPGALAIAAPDEQLTYGELADRAGRLAAFLHRHGVRPDVRVALCAGQTAGRVVGSLAILASGGACVHLDPEAPPERLRFLVADSEAAVVLTESALSGCFQACNARVACIADAARHEGVCPASTAGPDHLAYVVYTSGSTGLPKGVAVSHAGLRNLVSWHRSRYGIGPSDRATLIANPAFDASVWELWPHLAAGASLHLPPAETRLAPRAIVSFWRSAGITRSFLPTPLAEEVMAEEDLAGLSLRGLLCGGDRLRQAPLSGLPFALINHYGPSEVSVVSTYAPVLPESSGAPPIGRPIDNLRTFVVDPRGGLLPRGAVGELWLGGVGLARGYLSLPGLTAERFVPDPWNGEAGGRLYRTGDLVRHRSDGNLEFLGRIDNQIKLRGYRIELGEIEAALHELPAVGEAAVAFRAHEKQLVAYIVPALGEAPSGRELRQLLRERLPGYMVPAVYVALSALPRTPNGKLDRKALPAPAWDAAAEAPGTPPRTPAEELLAGIFTEVLGTGPIGIEDGFFERGGHSLAALRLAARVREAFGVDLPPSRVFETPTVAELAGEIESRVRSGASRLPPLRAVPRDRPDDPLPLSFAQQRLWFLHQLDPASPVYNVPAAIDLRGWPDPATLAAALGEVARRHEALRTRLVAAPGGPAQVVDPPAPALLPVVDLAQLPAARQQARRLAREEALRPFDLAAGPLLRALLVHLGGGEHLLLLTLHHVVCDGWSMRVLARELGEIYGGFSQGRPSPLPELAIQYGDYAVWQRAWLQGDVLEAELAHWRDRLAGAPPVLDLPLDRPRPAVVSHHGASRPLAFAPGLLPSLQALARDRGVTLFMAALAAFQALLSRVGNTGDVSVGTPVAGRTQLQTEGLIGFFVNLLVLRTDLSGEPSFAGLLGRVREVALTAYAHQDLPFEKLVEELAPQRDLSYPPLFQVSFALEHDPPPTLRLGEVEGTLWPLPQETEKVDLSLTLEGEAGQLSGTIGFRTSLFDGATIERLAGHFGRLLAGAVAEPQRRVTELPLLSEAETEQLLVEWSGAATAYPREATIHALFAEQAALRPKAVALVGEGGYLTYGELSRRAGALALRLAAWGVGPEVRVGVCLGRSPARIAATLAVLEAGGAYVPLDPSYPPERLAFLVRDSGASVLLTEERWRELLPQSGAAVLCLDQEESREGAVAGPARAPVLPATALAYVMYTSGSTGEPKGVAVPHRAVVRLVRDTAYARFGPDEVFLQLAPYAFDASTLELWGPLLNGGRVVMPPPGVPTPAELGDLLQRHGVTTLWLTAGLFHQMVDENLPGLSGVRQLLAGGDVLSVPHVRRVLAELPGTRLINGYGPTENTTFTCCHPVSDAEPATSIPLGRPIANTRVYVLDRHFEPVPAGVAGELLTGGDGLARGYLGGPERTAECFVPDPMAGEPGGRLYRTGDLVRWRPSGDLEFLGRIDTQVKIRGFRVEPGEIETALLAHPGVREALVLAPREEGGRRLVAYLVGSDGAAPRESELRDFLRERLPDFMLPSGFVVLPALPLTAHGKVDRKSLATLRPERSERTGPAPRTPTEELVAGIFAEVLGLEQVGIADDFFTLGGHSLLATRVVSRVRALFGVDLPVRTVFEAPTVEALAGRLDRAAGASSSPAPIERISRAEPPPLSFAQQRLWFLDRLEPGSPLYNIPVAVELAGRLDRPALEAALGAVVRRHEALRTTFRETADGPVQEVAESIDFHLPLVEVHSPQEEYRLSAEEARRPFDLQRGPLLRAVLLRSSPERHVLLVTLHHIVSDGWSMGVLVRELGALYAAFLAGRPSPLPELAIQYADFAAWQRRHLSGELLAAELAWWRGQLAGMPPALDLPADHPRPAMRSLRGASHAFAIPEEGLAALAQLARRQGATLFMTLLAGFGGLLHRSTGEDDVAVGTPIAGRTRTETEPLIGLFVNTLVLRLDLSGDPELAEILGRIRETTFSAYAHQEVPFERLVEELAPERDLSRTPLVQVMLVLQNAPLGALELPGLALAVSDRTTETAKLDLTCTLTETERGLAGTIEYSRDLFEAPAIERMAGHLTRLLAGAAAEPRRRLSELPLLSEAETAQLLVEWAGAAEPFPATTLHAAFESQAERHPDLPAVVSGGTVLAYRELDAAANRLARRLAALGVGPEVPVAFAFERSAAVVVAILGVLKAGGAYLPLDPSQPAERRAALLEAAGHPLLITEQDLAAPDPEEAVEPVPATPENLAYVLHTSGSTGLPKGVCCTHRGVVNLLADFARRQPLVPGSRGSLWTSLSFDVSVYEIFSPLLAGGAVHIVPEAVRQEAESFLDWLAAERIDSAYVPPFLVAALQERLERTGEPRLRRLLVGVEPIPEAQLARIAELSAGLAVINGYGPTEATICATLYDVDPRRDRSGQSPVTPIGRPAANSAIYLLDRHQQPVPVGVPGELYIAGAGLARGYLGKPDATAERFVPHPWSAAGGERLYRTGDLVRRRPDGNLEFLGRIDHQIKLRGFRIEPGEIETALLAHPGVREAVVMAVAPAGAAALEGREHRRLVAYVVAGEGGVPSVQELQEHLRERLPAYMVPAAFVLLPVFPLTPSGKLDRRALPAPGQAAAEELKPPRTPAEELVAGIFAEVLGVERVGVSDDFFALGGHSLLATRLVARVRTVFAVELPVRAVFEAPTVERMAAAIAEASRDGRLPESRPQARSEEIEALPLSFGQERLWFLQQLEPGSAAYDMPVQIELSGVLRRDVLAVALTGVVCRHESLRTAFGMAGGAPVQRIAPPPSAVPLPLTDLSDLPPAAGGGEAERLEREHASLRFDLERGPLFSALLVRLGAERHRLLLNLHHIVSDGWSIHVLVRDLGVLYGALLAGRPAPLPELPIQYADFALWQREQLAARQERELAYWESRLGEEAASAELPTDRPRPAVQTYRGGRHQLVLSPDLTARLQRLGREQGVTLFMTLLSAAKTVLFRHSSEPVVTVGAPVAGRRQAETEELIGFFLNTLALRTDLSGGPTFRELLARVRTTTLEAYSHQDVPFEAVLARLRLDRDLSRSPLFQVLFNLLNLPVRDFSLPGLELRLLTPAEVPSKLDLTFYVSEAEASVWIHLVYNADLFDAARIAELLAQLELLLELVTERPDEPVDHLPLLTAAARAVLHDPRETLAEPAFPPVGHLFLDRARALPERTAVCWSGGAWTYAELEARARETARRILAAGGGAGQVVAVSGNRSPELIASLLAVFLSGGVLLILDRKHPEARLRVMVEEAKPGCLIYIGEPQPEDGWLWKMGSFPVLTVRSGPAPVSAETDFPLPAPDDPAYIFFTSGTTGRPKAVLGRQKGLSHFLAWQRETFGIGPGDRAAQLTGLSFDVVLRDIFMPLTSGATLVVPDEEDLGPERILLWLRERAVTVVHTVPSLAGAWLGAAPSGFGSEALRCTFFAGEPLLGQLAERWRAAFPRTSVVNLYGPTETTLAKCFFRVPDPSAADVQPVGAPLPQTQALVLAGGERLCGLGEVGEIVLRTPFRSLGYLDNPEESRLRFRPNPFREEDKDDLLYFTGDRGRYQLEGSLEILGRLDEQVKIRGVRVEPAEIRAALGRHPAVWESAILVREHRGDQRLVACLVLRPDVALDVDALRRHLRQELPEAMVPSTFVVLDALPLTPNGKLDRRALARHEPEIAAAGAARALRTPTEEIVARLWAEVLGLPQVGPDDNFFQLGGHSLTGAQMVSRLREAFTIEIPLRVLFEAPTVATLAAEVERRRRPEGAPERPSIASFRQDRSAPPPLSFAQERFWAGRELEARTVASTIPMLFLLDGDLDPLCLRRALQEIVDRHEVLRTCFREEAGQPIQVVLPEVRIDLPTVDLEPLPPPERREEIRHRSALDGQRPFDFERGPLFRLSLFRCAGREHVLLFVIHHIAFDGWSRGVLLSELAVLYDTFRAGRPSPLRPLALQYQDFARWQRRRLQGEALEEAVGFWREHLRGALPVRLGGDRPPPVHPTFDAGIELFAVPAEIERRLEAFAAECCATLFMTLLAAFKVLLALESERDDIVVTCLFANRDQLETETLIGNFFAGLPLRTRFAGARTFRDLLARVRDVTLAAHEHPDILYEAAMEELGFLEPGDHGGLSTFRILFQLGKFPPAEQALSGLKLVRVPFDTGKIRQDLSLFFSQSDRLLGRFKYNRDVLDAETVVRLRDRLLHILAAVVADPDCPLGALLESPSAPEPVPAGVIHQEHQPLGGAL